MYIEACGEEMSRVSHYWNRGTDVRLGTAPLISKGGLTLLSGRFHATRFPTIGDWSQGRPPKAHRTGLRLTTFRINTCKSVSKQSTLTPFRINTCEKRGEGGQLTRPQKEKRPREPLRFNRGRLFRESAAHCSDAAE
jgi:hypothetical protein